MVKIIVIGKIKGLVWMHDVVVAAWEDPTLCTVPSWILFLPTFFSQKHNTTQPNPISLSSGVFACKVLPPSYFFNLFLFSVLIFRSYLSFYLSIYLATCFFLFCFSLIFLLLPNFLLCFLGFHSASSFHRFQLFPNPLPRFPQVSTPPISFQFVRVFLGFAST